jgi:hypothetical protein
MVIIVGASSRCRPQGETNGEHQQWGDFVDHEIAESIGSNVEPLKGMRLRHRDTEPVGEHPGQSRHA